MTPRLIEVRNLHYRYPDATPALTGVDFTLDAGESVILLGANGSGKTTFLLHLNGLLLGEGELAVCGMRVEKRTLPEIRRKVGFVFQNSEEQLFLSTVEDDAAFGPLNQGLPRDEAYAKAHAALARVGVAHCATRAPHHLSAGEKKRVAIAGVLAMEPEILVFDEPTTFLDPLGQRSLIALLKDLPQAKVVATHDLALARALGTRAVFFENGAILSEGGADELIARHRWDLARG